LGIGILTMPNNVLPMYFYLNRYWDLYRIPIVDDEDMVIGYRLYKPTYKSCPVKGYLYRYYKLERLPYNNNK